MTNFGPPPQQYGPPYPQQQYGAPQHGAPQHGAPQYGAPQQQYGQQWAAPAQPFPQAPQQGYPQQQVPWGVAPPQQQYDARAQDRKAAVRQMAIGGVVALIGIIITIVTYRAASDGGHYVVAWGPAIFGLIAFVRGLVSYVKA